MLKRILSALLVGTFCLSAFACSGDTASSDDTTSASGDGQTSVDAATTTEAEVDPLAGLDFDGAEFNGYIGSVSDWGILSSAPLMIAEAENGDIVNDTVYARNLAVSEKMNVVLNLKKFETEFTKIVDEVRQIALSGDDVYDIIVNDIYYAVELAAEGMFVNAENGKYFDFTKDYWDYEYMRDLMIGEDKVYILNGDYFIDAICNAHALFVNVDKFNDRYGSIDTLYGEVLDKSWNIDKMIEYVAECYSDLDGDGARSKDDFFGYIVPGYSGSTYPYLYGSDVKLVSRDGNNIPSIDMNNEKVVNLYSKIVDLYTSEGTEHALFFTDTDPSYLTKFTAGGSLFEGYSRLCTLADLRAMDDDVTLVPYPLMTETQDTYYTVTDDCVELGFIPITCSDLDMVSAVLEELCRTTGDTVLKTYYETALKVKYVRDDYASQMLDIIKNGLITAFPIVYNHMLDDIFLSTLQGMISKDSNDSASLYTGKEAAAKAKLDGLIENYGGLE